MKISRRAEALPESAIRKLVPYSDSAKSRGVKVYHLNIGQPDIRTPDTFLNAIKQYDLDVLAYGPSNGLLEYRKGLQRYYRGCGIETGLDTIFVTTAGSEALLFAIISLTDPGDNILVMEPFYTNYSGFSAMVNVEVRGIPTTAETGFAIPDLVEFEKRMDANTRAIIICNPNNPTGAVYPKEDLIKLSRFVMEHDLFLISDEVYREFTYDGLKHFSIMQMEDLGDHAIMVDSISKRYSACGARIGCLVTRNKDVLRSVMRMGQARLCPPTLEQIGAIAALDTPAQYLNSVISEYQLRRDVLLQGLMSIPGVFCKKPLGAFYMIVNLPVEDADHFAQFMLEDFTLDGATVMVAPGSGFYATPGKGRNQVRVAYVLKKEDLEVSVKILAAGLNHYNSRYC
jgi:aspartate aminotransferase